MYLKKILIILSFLSSRELVASSKKIIFGSLYNALAMPIPLDFTPHNYYLSENSNKILKIENKNYLLNVKKFLQNSKNKKTKMFYHKKHVSKNIIRHLKKIL